MDFVTVIAWPIPRNKHVAGVRVRFPFMSQVGTVSNSCDKLLNQATSPFLMWGSAEKGKD